MDQKADIPVTAEGLMEYYESVMTYSDRADVDREVLKAYAEHAVMLRNHVPWCMELPQEIFLPCVAAYRINNEAIVDVRAMFFQEIYPRVQDKSLYEAILEVNYWCAEHCAYHSSDYRTASALTVYKTGLGRCGEGSVLGVTALRSVGIAARQVYTPLWAHCDDNHAWVEVWCDGGWQFLGSCEPEVSLNRGWFTQPASRAMLVHARYFGKAEVPDKYAEDGGVSYINSTANYARTRPFSLKVLNTDGTPAAGLTVEFQLLNYGSYRNLITMYTDGAGAVGLETGMGDMRIQVRNESMSQVLQVPYTADHMELVFDGTQMPLDVWEEYHVHAPEEGEDHSIPPDKEQEEKNSSRLANSKRLREDRIHSYFNKSLAAEYPDMEEYLKLAGGNFSEVYQFLHVDHHPYRRKLVADLAEKDLYDCRADILEEHFQYALKRRWEYPDDIFISYVMNPRVEYEELSLYRKGILDYFSPSMQEEFVKEPETLWRYIQTEFHYDRREDYPTLRITPMGALRTKKANPESKKILFAAIMRTLGVPARRNPQDTEPEYYKDGRFHPVSLKEDIEKNAMFLLELKQGEDWKYRTSWTISRRENGTYHTLDLEEEGLAEGLNELPVVPGTYQFIITSRLPDGGQLVRELHTNIRSGERKTVTMIKQKPEYGNKAAGMKLDSFPAVTQDGHTLCLADRKNGARRLYVWLGIGEEPTEHVLNEMLTELEYAKEQNDRIFFLIRDFAEAGNKTLANVLEKTGANVYRPEDFELWHSLSESLGARHHRLPLALVTDGDGHGVYGCTGYNVGSVHQMLACMKDS